MGMQLAFEGGFEPNISETRAARPAESVLGLRGGEYDLMDEQADGTGSQEAASVQSDTVDEFDHTAVFDADNQNEDHSHLLESVETSAMHDPTDGCGHGVRDSVTGKDR
jgi:hypothetical protein